TNIKKSGTALFSNSGNCCQKHRSEHTANPKGWWVGSGTLGIATFGENKSCFLIWLSFAKQVNAPFVYGFRKM
ncbi:hypothetical protein, partial [Kingella kingae]|uniref:hypothetical protein n=1 Tax=Kingella kingae TaxID=504 RepID=UPI0025513D2C